MDQITKAYQRIEVVLGVSGGVISVGQVQAIAALHRLDEAQQAELNRMLSGNGICPIPDEALPQPVPEKPRKRELTPEERAEHFDQAVLACLKDMKEVPGLAEQYQEEIPLLKQAIAEESAASGQRSPDRIITRAVMAISRYRVRDVRHKGWVCGTHSSQVRDLFRRRLNTFLTAGEQSALIQFCSGPDAEPNSHFTEMLLVLLHHTPHTIVHLYLSDYCSD